MQGSSETRSDRVDTNLVDAQGDEAKSVDVPDRRRAEPQAVHPPAVPATTPESGSAENDVGATVLAEARELVEQRRFADAARVLESVERLRPDDPEVLSLIAVSNAYLRRHRSRVRSSLARLSTDFGSSALTWRTVSDVSAARLHFDPAQTAARTAVQMAPGSVRNWHALAASYAGNGWFNEATDCLHEADKIDPAGRYRPENHTLTFGQWQVGRAVNHWALSRTYLALFAFVAFVWLGLLGLALALSTPMLVREVRVRQLPDPFRSLADHSWRSEHRLRILNAVAVMGVLTTWVVVFSITR